MNSDGKTSGPWYGDGLRFECTQCGNCCTGSPGFVWVDEEELAAIARHVNRSIGEIRLMHTRLARGRVTLREHANGDCVFLDPRTRLCSIYEARPKQCRSWPFWKSNIASQDAWEQTGKVCPGCGQGDFVSAAELEQSADLIEL
jgi:Fe-S-cluster containining protein